MLIVGTLQHNYYKEKTSKGANRNLIASILQHNYYTKQGTTRTRMSTFTEWMSGHLASVVGDMDTSLTEEEVSLRVDESMSGIDPADIVRFSGSDRVVKPGKVVDPAEQCHANKWGGDKGKVAKNGRVGTGTRVRCGKKTAAGLLGPNEGVGMCKTHWKAYQKGIAQGHDDGGTGKISTDFNADGLYFGFSGVADGFGDGSGMEQELRRAKPRRKKLLGNRKYKKDQVVAEALEEESAFDMSSYFGDGGEKTAESTEKTAEKTAEKSPVVEKVHIKTIGEEKDDEEKAYAIAFEKARMADLGFGDDEDGEEE